jgi:ABC-type phosphate transport system substrate-binding protein
MAAGALTFTVALFAAAFLAQAAAPPRAAAYRIICHPSNPDDLPTRQFLEDAFLKRTTRWPSGEKIRPVDLAPSSPVRRQFSDEVLRRPVEAVRSYWQQRIFAGRELPPPEVDDDEEVVKFVLRHPGAVGYVSGGASLGGVKVLTVK